MKLTRIRTKGVLIAAWRSIVWMSEVSILFHKMIAFHSKFSLLHNSESYAKQILVGINRNKLRTE